MRPALIQRRVDDVRIVVRARRHPTEEELDAHIAEAVQIGNGVRGVLVVTEEDGDGRISTAFRARLIRAGLFEIPTAVLTDSMMRRVELDAVNRIGGNVRTFSASELEAALDYLAVARPVRAEIRAALESMKAEVFGQQGR